jgi:Putative prokaryotic signal transducing protein
MTGDREDKMRHEISADEELVTIAKFLEPVNAQLAKGVLESAGIASFLQGENANSMMAFAFRARLQVERRDEAAARELLADLIAEEGEGVEEDGL